MELLVFGVFNIWIRRNSAVDRCGDTNVGPLMQITTSTFGRRGQQLVRRRRYAR
jgi:hypothetical protein